MQKNIAVGEATDDNMAHAYCTLGTYGYEHIFPEYVKLIAFLLQLWFHECVSMLRHTYSACFVRRIFVLTG
jgi:hypothetical protein